MKINSMIKNYVSIFTTVCLIATTTLLFTSVQHTHAETPNMEIAIAKSTYQYCEKLSYVVTVSEVTGQTAIARIIDQNQKSSQDIPIPIKMLENEIKAPFPFEKAIFPTGTYTINMTYSGAQSTANFEIIDSDNICIPSQIKQIAAGWITGTISDGFMIDAIKKSVEPKLINVTFEIDQNNIYNIVIPEWVKTVTYWWVIDDISDNTIAGVFDYLLKTGVINVQNTHKGNN